MKKNNTISKEEFAVHGYNVTEEQAQELNLHYHYPKNRWALKKYNARGIGRNANNHGQVDMYLLINDNEIIENIGYEFNGCAIISFSASVFTEDMKGLMIEKAHRLVQNALHQMISQDDCERCTLMILEAFLGAYENYHNRKKSPSEEFSLRLINLENAVPQVCGKKREVVY
ncbi:MAG: iron-sulfur cluster assembly scaffold protein [Epsilonproteobacteria bacterium]|nr:iron-sulfur cluster assembly scaffold protein [Campylobacterota bacterium]